MYILDGWQQENGTSKFSISFAMLILVLSFSSQLECPYESRISTRPYLLWDLVNIFLDEGVG